MHHQFIMEYVLGLILILSESFGQGTRVDTPFWAVRHLLPSASLGVHPGTVVALL